MRRAALAALLIGAFVFVPGFAQSPPGGQGIVQPTKTGSYTVKSSDLKSVIPFICPGPCIVTMPTSTASWPKGYPVAIVNAGTNTVTVHAVLPSTIIGMPTATGDLLLTSQGNYVVLTANKDNNYVAFGQIGAGGGGGGGVTNVRLTNTNGKRLTNTNGFRLTNGS